MPCVAVYQPPDAVVVAIGSAYPGAAVVAAGQRLVGQAEHDREAVEPWGLTAERAGQAATQLDALGGMLRSARAQKHDTSLQMKDAPVLMARVRRWLYTLRLVAGVNLAADTPALYRLASPEPELVEGYPRDLLQELERRLTAASDLAPRLSDAGLDRAFLSTGRRLAGQLRTAVGPRDLRPEDLELELRRLYLRKGTVFLELKRWTRIGQLAHLDDPPRGEAWHLRELEPSVPRPVVVKG